MINLAKDLLRPTWFVFIETVKLKELSQSILSHFGYEQNYFELKEPENSCFLKAGFSLATESESHS